MASYPHRSLLDRQLTEELTRLREHGLERHLETLDGPGPRVRAGQEALLSFSSNDYLGLASSHRMLGTAAHAGAGASRLVTGTHEKQVLLETALASFVGREEALLFSSGYALNVGVVPALVGPDDLLLSDELNHASLIDGARLSGATKRIFRHRDLEHLESLLEDRPRFRRALLVTDAVFSMEATVAPLREYAELASRYALSWLVDEAHSCGLLGPGGAGLCMREGVRPDVLVGTLGKSFGCCGAFVAGSRTLTRWLVQRARSFVFSTAPSPVLTELIREALTRVREADELRDRVLAHASRLRRGLRQLGLDVRGEESAIVPVVYGSPDQALEASRALREQGILARAIRPPTVPSGTSRLRLVPTAAHESEDVTKLLTAFQSFT